MAKKNRELKLTPDNVLEVVKRALGKHGAASGLHLEAILVQASLAYLKPYIDAALVDMENPEGQADGKEATAGGS